jgi:hypothetical protein
MDNMTELQLQLIASSKIIWLALFSLLYGLGGMNGKWKRRIVGSLFLGLGIIVYSLVAGAFSYWLLIYPLLLWGALSIGYGADITKEKVLKRMRYGFAIGFAALPIAIITQQWIMFGSHILLCMGIATLYGVLNPIHARSEETIIACAVGLTPLLMV